MKCPLVFCLLFGISLFLPHIVLGQKEAAIWYFGNRAGLDFNFSPPKAIISQNILTSEGCSSISDSTGNLLFYTDGRTVWNKQHLRMENGENLRGNTSSTHSSVVLKKPLSETKYYIITSDAYTPSNYGVNYSMVDLTYNNGDGKVVSKNIPLVGSSAEKIAVTPHLNKKHAWVAIPEMNTAKLHIYFVNESGFNFIGSYTGLFPIIKWGPGQIKFSPDGKHLLIIVSSSNGTSAAYIMDFNNSTGLVSGSQVINGGYYFYGAEFSPNSKYVYLASSENSPVLCQCKVLPGTFNYVSDCKSYLPQSQVGQLQLGPDQKIYVAKYNKRHLGVINFPDADFTLTDYIDSAIGLPSSTKCHLGLPTFNTAYLYSPPIKIMNNCAGDTTRFSIDTVGLVYDSISWLINGQNIFKNKSSGTHFFNQTGTFPISVIVFLGTNADTFIRSVIINPLPIHPQLSDTSLCSGQSITFNAWREKGVQYKWNTGKTDSALTTLQPGLYTVELTKNGCTVTDSLQLSVHPYPVVNIPDEIIICKDNPYTASALDSAATYLWSTGDTTASVQLNNEQLYWVAVTQQNCTTVDSFNIYTRTLPTPNLGPDTALCDTLLYQLNAAYPYSHYLWNTGSTDSILTINKAGLYVVRVETLCGAVYDSVQFSYKPYPEITIPDEVIICSGNPFTTNTPSDNLSYLWSTGDTTSTVALNNEGSFWVAVTKDNCTSIDTFSLFITTLPMVNLGPDTGICENQTFTLNITQPYSQYQWNTGSADPIFEATKAGLYSVKIENPCGTVYDSILIRQNICNCPVWAPNAFTPNGDLTNDLFMPSLSCEYTTFDFRIYSKWGEEIFHSTSTLNAWDGRYKGAYAPTDVYVWKLTCVQTNTVGKEFISDSSGTVTLLR